MPSYNSKTNQRQEERFRIDGAGNRKTNEPEKTSTERIRKVLLQRNVESSCMASEQSNVVDEY